MTGIRDEDVNLSSNEDRCDCLRVRDFQGRE
jgi:hypothetical protein